MNTWYLSILKFFFGADLATSKKFRTFIIGILTTTLAPIMLNKLGMPQETVTQVINWIAGLAGMLLAGQGMADFGKAATTTAPDLPLPPPPDDPLGVPGEPEVK